MGERSEARAERSESLRSPEGATNAGRLLGAVFFLASQNIARDKDVEGKSLSLAKCA